MESRKELMIMDVKSTFDSYLLESPIQKLNEYNLIMIFNYLSIVDRINVERVSKTWQEIAKKSWTKVKILKFHPEFLGLRPFGTKYQNAINKYTFDKILKRCGKYLTKIDTTSTKYTFNFDECLLSLVAKHCPNIQSIVCFAVSREGLEALMQNVRSLSEFSSIWVLEKDCEDILSRLFTKNKKIRILNLCLREMKGYCLFNLPLTEITKINITEINNSTFQKNLTEALKKTKNMKSFSFDHTNAEIIRVLASVCTNFTTLNLSSSLKSKIENVEEMFSKLFLCNRNLKFLTLHLHEVKLTGQCLLSVNCDSIEAIELKFFDFQVFKLDYLITCLPTFQKLHTFALWHYKTMHMHDIAKCINLCLNVKKLELSNLCPRQSPNVLMKSISVLKNLESLSLISQTLSTDFCKFISSNLLKLNFLDIGCCENVSDVDLESLQKLPNLEVLDISGIDNITGSGIRHFFKLKKFRCATCSNLEDDCLISLLQCAINLEYLNMNDTPKVTNAVIDFAIEVIKKRTNNIILILGIRDFNVDFEELQGTSPLLIFDVEDSFKYIL